MTVEPLPHTGPPVTDALALAAELPLTEDEAAYVEAARAPNTLRGYRSDWAEFTTWCTRLPRDPLPAAADTITAYLSELARAGAKVGTMSRRLSSIRFAHQLLDLPDPTTGARVVAVWEGIRRTHGAPPEQAAPLMPPQLFDVLDACPTTRTWKTRPGEPHLSGLRDRALLLVAVAGRVLRSAAPLRARRPDRRANQHDRVGPDPHPAGTEALRPDRHAARAARVGPPTQDGPRRVPRAAAGRRGGPQRLPLGDAQSPRRRPGPNHAPGHLGRTRRPALRPNSVVRPDQPAVHRRTPRRR